MVIVRDGNESLSDLREPCGLLAVGFVVRAARGPATRPTRGIQKKNLQMYRLVQRRICTF